VHTKTVFA